VTDEELDYRLFKGISIPLSNGLIISQKSFDTIQEEIGYSMYEGLVFFISRLPYEFKFDLEDAGIDYTTLNSFDLFLMLIAAQSEASINALGYMFEYKTRDGVIVNDKFVLKKSNDGEVFIESLYSLARIDKSSISEIRRIFMRLYFMTTPKERIAANDAAKELIKMDLAQNRKQKSTSNIFSMLSSLVWAAGSSYKYSEVGELTPHQIHLGCERVNKFLTYNHFMTSYYSGNIEAKGIDSKIEKVHWSNK